MFMTIVSSVTKTRMLFSGLFLVLIFVLPVDDSDYFWHLKTGEYIVSQRSLPAGDIFSSMHLGQPWVLHEWLFEVVLYLMFAWLGTTGVQLLMASLTLLTLGTLFVLMRRITASLNLTMVLLLMVFVPFAVGISPRPQMVTYFCFCIYVFVLVIHKYFDSGMLLWLLPLFMVIWVNSHGGYVIGIALLSIFAACEWVSYWNDRLRKPSQRNDLVRLSQVACATVLASLVNPGLFERWIYPFQVLGMAANEHISEWQSPNFHTFSAKSYLLVVLLFFLSNVYAKRKPDLTEAVVPTFFLVTGFLAVRHIPLAVLAIAPFCAIALARCDMRLFAERLRATYFVKALTRLNDKSPELGEREFFLNWSLLAVLGIVLFINAPALQSKADKKLNEVLPVNAASFVLANEISGNLFNTYHYGGYLIYRFWPHRKVLIDGRADMYGDKFVNDYMQIHDGRQNWREKFKQLSIDYVIVGVDAPIRQLLRADADFVEVYSDSHHSVLLRNSAKYRSLLDRLKK